jgi:hypothetical protein
MLDEMDAVHLTEWRDFMKWEDEMGMRETMQSAADAKLEQLRREKR